MVVRRPFAQIVRTSISMNLVPTSTSTAGLSGTRSPASIIASTMVNLKFNIAIFPKAVFGAELKEKPGFSWVLPNYWRCSHDLFIELGPVSAFKMHAMSFVGARKWTRFLPLDFKRKTVSIDVTCPHKQFTCRSHLSFKYVTYYCRLVVLERHEANASYSLTIFIVCDWRLPVGLWCIE